MLVTKDINQKISEIHIKTLQAPLIIAYNKYLIIIP